MTTYPIDLEIEEADRRGLDLDALQRRALYEELLEAMLRPVSSE